MKKLLVALLIVAVTIASSSASGIIKRRVQVVPVIVTDNFNRADENPLDNGVWTTGTGWNPMQIVSNTATKTVQGAHNLSYYTGASFGTNQYAEAIRTGVLGYMSVGCRWSANNGYLVKVEDSADWGAIYRVDAGIETILGATFTHTGTSGETIRLECSGSTITFKSNGSTVASRTDNTYSSGSPCIYQYNETSNLDDFAGGDL